MYEAELYPAVLSPGPYYSMVPIKRTVFLLTVYGMKNTVRLTGTLEYQVVELGMK